MVPTITRTFDTLRLHTWFVPCLKREGRELSPETTRFSRVYGGQVGAGFPVVCRNLGILESWSDTGRIMLACRRLDVSFDVIPGHVKTFWLGEYHHTYLLGSPAMSLYCLLLSYYGASRNPVEPLVDWNQQRGRSGPLEAAGTGGISGLLGCTI